jgi:hypothetical protein
MTKWIGAMVLALTALAVACAKDGSRDVPVGPTPNPGTDLPVAPVPEAPVNDAEVVGVRPTFTVRNGTASGSTPRTYEFQVSDRTDFSVVLASQGSIAEGVAGTTSFTPSGDLPASTRLYWRARVVQGAVTSGWSTTALFRTTSGAFNRPGELFDPLVGGTTLGQRVGSITDMGSRGLRVDNNTSWIRYELAATLTSGEISVEVEGLAPNGAEDKSRIFSMMDGGNNLFDSKFLFNVQYRGRSGNPDNAISYKVLMGDSDLKYEPDFGQRSAGVRALNPGTTYLWTATWGSSFQLTVREGGVNGPIVYQQGQGTPGFYNPAPHTVYLGANDAAQESGSYAGAIYRNLWVGNRPRPASLGMTTR